MDISPPAFFLFSKMDIQNPVQPFLSCIGLSITDACPISCSHCIMGAGPARKTKMSAHEAHGWLKQASEYRNHHITSTVITGGEPFYDPDLLGNVLQSAGKCGLVAAVMTNAFWADSPEKARAVLAAMPNIKMLSISTDVYHQKFIPLLKVKNAILACDSLDIAHSVAVCIEHGTDETASEEAIGSLGKILPERHIKISHVYPAGRAKDLPSGQIAGLGEAQSYCCGSADYPTIFPDGSVIGCMGIVHRLPTGHPLLLGNAKDEALSRILDKAEGNLFLHTLRLWGAQAILEHLRKRGGMDDVIKSPSGARNCDFCYSLANNPSLLKRLEGVFSHDELKEKIAYARVFYFNESELANTLSR
jgi:pyruvate-formate lyase-activating enzyme